VTSGEVLLLAIVLDAHGGHVDRFGLGLDLGDLDFGLLRADDDRLRVESRSTFGMSPPLTETSGSEPSFTLALQNPVAKRTPTMAAMTTRTMTIVLPAPLF
jgi:hypothetical protein